jgi:hypothetical protein
MDYASNGSVRLPATAAHLSSSSQAAPADGIYIPAIDYTQPDFNGQSLVWTTSYQDCSSLIGASLPPQWSDRVESVVALDNCATTLYRNANYTGSDVPIGVNGSAATLGSLNDAASSQIFCNHDNCQI